MDVAKILVGATSGIAKNRQRIPARAAGLTVSVVFVDSVWDNLAKTVVFRGTGSRIAEFDGKTAVIPWEVLAEPGIRVYFGIYGTNAETGVELPLIEVDIGVTERSTDPQADPGTDPTLPIWAQLQEDVEGLKQQGGGGAGTPGKPGADGEDGGYYTPSVTQPDEDTIQFNFTPSKPDMPTVEPVTVELPSGQGSGGNANQGGGLSTEAANLLITILQNAVYTSNQTGNIVALAEALTGESVVVLTRISATYSGGEVEVGTAVTALTGVVVTAHYSNGSTATVSDYTLSGVIAEGNNVITVSYGGMTTTFTVMGVSEETEVTLSSISATYSGGDVTEGTAMTDLTGIVVTAHYSDGSTATVTGYTLSGTITVGENTITVSYGGKTTTFKVTGIAAVVPDDITVVDGIMTIISVGSEITVSNGVMTIA